MVSPASLDHSADRSHTVLIVDDDEYVHGTLEAALRGLHLHLLIASSAAEGETLALEYRPALAIIDVGLPDRSGYELTASLRRRGLGTRILILTGHAPDEAAAREAGADAIVAKPFRLHHFLDLVRQQLYSGTRPEPEPGLAARSSSAA